MSHSKTLLILGAGGFGRELLFFAESVQAAERAWTIGGFLDDNADALRSYSYQHRVVGPIRGHIPRADQLFLMAIGDPTKKLEIGGELRARGGEFLTLRHHSALVGNNVRLGIGVVICPNVSIPCDSKIGDFVTVNTGCTIAHDTEIGDGTTFSGHVDMTGFSSLGKGVFLGSHASVLPRVKVGDFARIGAGSMVVRNVRPGVTVFGVPAKEISST